MPKSQRRVFKPKNKKMERHCLPPQPVQDEIFLRRKLPSSCILVAAPRMNPAVGHAISNRLVQVDQSNARDLGGSDRNAIIQWFKHQTHPASNVLRFEPLRTAP
jgi:hypothetical protein